MDYISKILADKLRNSLLREMRERKFCLSAWEKENNATQPYELCAYTWFGSVGDIILQPVKAQHTAKGLM